MPANLRTLHALYAGPLVLYKYTGDGNYPGTIELSDLKTHNITVHSGITPAPGMQIPDCNSVSDFGSNKFIKITGGTGSNAFTFRIFVVQDDEGNRQLNYCTDSTYGNRKPLPLLQITRAGETGDVYLYVMRQPNSSTGETWVIGDIDTGIDG